MPYNDPSDVNFYTTCAPGSAICPRQAVDINVGYFGPFLDWSAYGNPSGYWQASWATWVHGEEIAGQSVPSAVTGLAVNDNKGDIWPMDYFAPRFVVQYDAAASTLPIAFYAHTYSHGTYLANLDVDYNQRFFPINGLRFRVPYTAQVVAYNILGPSAPATYDFRVSNTFYQANIVPYWSSSNVPAVAPPLTQLDPVQARGHNVLDASVAHSMWQVRYSPLQLHMMGFQVGGAIEGVWLHIREFQATGSLYNIRIAYNWLSGTFLKINGMMDNRDRVVFLVAQEDVASFVPGRPYYFRFTKPIVWEDAKLGLVLEFSRDGPAATAVSTLVDFVETASRDQVVSWETNEATCESLQSTSWPFDGTRNAGTCATQVVQNSVSGSGLLLYATFNMRWPSQFVTANGGQVYTGTSSYAGQWVYVEFSTKVVYDSVYPLQVTTR